MARKHTKKAASTTAPPNSLAHAKVGDTVINNSSGTPQEPACYELLEIPISSIATPVQVRDVDLVHVQRLADAIKAGDVLPPIEVFRIGPMPKAKNAAADDYILGPGRHRLEAHKLAGLDRINAFVRPPASIEQIERAQLLENLNRHDMLPIEEANNVARLLANTRDAAYVAKNPDAAKDAVGHVAAMLGRSKAWVQDRMYIDRLAKPVRTLARIAQIPAGHLRELAKLGDEQQQWELACDIVHLGFHTLKPDFKTGTIGWPATRSLLTSEDEFRAQIAEGSIRRMTVEEVSREVEGMQRPLKGVPWDLSLPVIAGKNKRKTDLPACAGCEHNSVTNTALFEIDDDKGVCHNAVCYQAKKDAAEQAKKHLVSAFNRRKNAPDAAEIDAKAPEWLKRNTARGVVQRQFKQKPKANASETSSSNRFDPYSDRKRQLTDHEKAMQRFETSLDDWYKQGTEQVMKRLRSQEHALEFAVFCAMTTTQALELTTNWIVPHISVYSAPAKESPKEPKPLDKQIIKALMRLADPDNNGVIEAAEIIVGMKATAHYLPKSLHDFITTHNPEMLQRLATVVDVELKACPHWRDFEPAPAKKKPATKKTKKTKKKAKTKGKAKSKPKAKASAGEEA